MADDIEGRAVEWIETDSLAQFKDLMESGEISIDDSLPPNNASYLHEAASAMSRDVMEYLIQKGADVNKLNDLDDTPFGVFMESLDEDSEHAKEDFKLLNLFLDKGANPNTLIPSEKTYPILLAVQNVSKNRIKWIGQLLNKGANIDAKNNVGYTALHLACSYKLPKLVFFLLTEEADKNARDNENRTPLHIAAGTSVVEIVEMLLDWGADKTLKDNKGKLPYDYTKVPFLKTLLYVEPPPPPSTEKYKGYSKSDAELFNQMFEEPNEWSCCPVCLAYVRRTDGCMYMKHSCKSEDRHEALFELYKDTRYNRNGDIEWCTICGRASFGHKHYKLSLAKSTTKPEFADIAPDAAVGVERHFDADCKRVGGGGFEEKVRRVHRLLGYACELQDEVGKILATEARKELIEEVWNAGSARNRAVPKMVSNKKFEFPCTFPEDAAPTTAEVEKVYPDIARPADEKDLTPIEHVAPDNECAIELGPHDDGRPVYEFRHKQADGSVYKHETICAPDLEQLIRAQPIDGKCRIEPDKCKALLYPEELYDIVTPEFYETYRKLFNKANAKEGGSRLALSGGGRRRTRKRHRFRGGKSASPIMKPLDMDTATCAPPPKAGNRKTFKKRAYKSQTRRRRV